MLETSLTQLTFKQADHYNLPRVKQFYKQHGMRAQAPKGDEIYIASLQTKIVAALRLQPVGDVFLLRSMCVDSNLRQQGIGSALLDYLQPRLGSIECYCFPFDHLLKFYQSANFISVLAESAPQGVHSKFERYINNGKKICLMKHQPHSVLK